MKKVSKFSVLMAVAMMGIGSFAQAADANKWELFTGGLASVDFVNQGGSQTLINIASPLTKVGVTIGYMLGDGFEILLSPMFSSNSNGTTNPSAYQVMAGVNYNFMSDWSESLYLEAQAGIYATSSSASGAAAATSTSQMAWSAGLGKRFKIVDHVQWSPELVYTSVATATATTTFSIIPIQLSVQM